MADERAMTEDEIETMAWDLETKMMEIRKDPRAALSAGLAKVRATMLAEMRAAMDADLARMEADFAKARAEREADIAEARAKREADIAKLAAEWAGLLYPHPLSYALHSQTLFVFANSKQRSPTSSRQPLQ